MVDFFVGAFASAIVPTNVMIAWSPSAAIVTTSAWRVGWMALGNGSSPLRHGW